MIKCRSFLISVSYKQWSIDKAWSNGS